MSGVTFSLVNTTNSATGTVVSGSFSPLAGHRYLALGALDDNNGPTDTVSWASGGSGTWTLLKPNHPAFNPGCSAWIVDAATSPGASTVQCVQTGFAGTSLTILDITGSDPVNPLGAFSAPAAGSVNSATLTPQFTGSIVVFVASCANSGTALASPNAATTQEGQYVDPAGMSNFTGVLTAQTTAGTPVTPGCSTTAQASTVVLAIEIVPVRPIVVSIDPNSPASGNISTSTVPAALSYTMSINNTCCVVKLFLKSANNSAITGTVSDNHGNTFTLISRGNGTGTSLGSTVELWGHDYVVPPGATTLTGSVASGTCTGGEIYAVGLLNTDLAHKGTSPTAVSNTAAGALGITFVPLGNNGLGDSLIIGAIHESASTTAVTMNTNSTEIWGSGVSGGVTAYSETFKSASPANSSATFGSSTSSRGHVVAQEFRYVPGTPAPAVVVNRAALIRASTR